MGPLSHLVVAVDGSAASAAAVRWAAEVAHLAGARVTAVHAADLVERFRSHAADERSFEERLREDVDRDWCGPLRHQGVVYEVVVRPGNPADTVLDVATDGGDLVVVGRRGIDRPDLGRLGSTSLQLAAESPLPVVVVAAPTGS